MTHKQYCRLDQGEYHHLGWSESHRICIRSLMSLEDIRINISLACEIVYEFMKLPKIRKDEIDVLWRESKSR